MSDAPTARDVAQQLDNMVAVQKRFVAFPSELEPVKQALFAGASHAVLDLHTVPYLNITAPAPECGKTVNGTIVGKFMHGRPFPLGKATPAAIRRSLSAVENSSLVLDELDLVDPYSEYGMELFQTINSGYSRDSSGSIRADSKSAKNVLTESTFGFKVLINIDKGKIPSTTMSRCVVVRLMRALPGETVELWEPTAPQSAYVDEAADSFAHVFSRLTWSWKPQADCEPGEVSLYPEAMEGDEFFNRDRQKWRALVAVAEYAGPEWVERCLAAFRDEDNIAEEKVPSLVTDITQALFTEDGDLFASVFTFESTEGMAIPGGDLCRYLVGLPNSRWTEEGKRPELTATRLTLLLKQFGIRSKKRAIVHDSKKNHRSFLIDDLRALDTRYGAKDPYVEDKSGRHGRTQSYQGFQPFSKVVDDPDSTTSQNGANVDTAHVLPPIPLSRPMEGNPGPEGDVGDDLPVPF